MAWKSRLPQAAAQLDNRLDAAVKAAAEAIEHSAKARVVVASGRLRDAIHTERIDEGEYAVVAGDNDAFYGHMVEFGTTHTPARPFLIPAAEENRAKFEQFGRAALKGL